MVTVGTDFEQEYPGASARATECYANTVRTGDLLIGLHNREALEDFGLSGGAKQALAVIEGAGEPLEPGVIAERLIITSGSMTSVLDTLEKRGLVRRRPHPRDRRKLLVEITDEGRAIVDRLLPSLHLRERAVMERALTAGEQRQLLTLLAKVQQAGAAEAGVSPHREARRVRPKRAQG